MNSKAIKKSILFVTGMACLCLGTIAFATSGTGIAVVAETAQKNLGAIALLLTAGSYVAGMGFGIASITQFKAHKENPTQYTISKPIALLFIAAALLFIPSVFKSAGGTLFENGSTGGITGVTSF